MGYEALFSTATLVHNRYSSINLKYFWFSVPVAGERERGGRGGSRQCTKGGR